MVLRWCSALQLYHLFCDDNKVQRASSLLLIMAVEMGVQSAEHLLIAEMLCSNSLSNLCSNSLSNLCSNSLSLPTTHYPPFPVFTIPFEVFSCHSAK